MQIRFLALFVVEISGSLEQAKNVGSIVGNPAARKGRWYMYFEWQPRARWILDLILVMPCKIFTTQVSAPWRF